VPLWSFNPDLLANLQHAQDADQWTTPDNREQEGDTA
jgi:hypothetical protein